MHKISKSSIVALVLFFSLSFLSFAQDNPAKGENFTSNITLGSQLSYYGRTLPYVDWLIPTISNPSGMAFLNPRYVNTANGKGHEGNYGAGFRQLLFNDALIVGFNTYYDRRKSENSFTYNQVGAGVEALSQWLDFRFNYYWPLTQKQFLGQTAEFGETKLLVYDNYEEPLQGFDAEGGFLIPYVSDLIETKIYVGGYHYISRIDKNISGFKYGLEMHPFENIAIEVDARHDNLHDTEIFGGVRISIPFSFGDLIQKKNPFSKSIDGFTKLGKKRLVKDRMNEIVRRDIDVVTNSASRLDNNLTKEMIYVDNKTSGTGEGTLSSPYHNLEDAFVDSRYLNTREPWIYVSKGDGTSQGYTGQYILKNGATIWGEGYAYLGLGGSGYPIIEADGAEHSRTLTLSGNNTVMGLQITGGADTGIYAENANNLSIHHNIITGNGSGAGFDIVSGLGFYTVTGIAVLNTSSRQLNNIHISNNIISENGLEAADDVQGVGLLFGNSSNSGSISLVAANNTIEDNLATGIFGYNVATSGAILHTQITNNIIEGNGQGLGDLEGPGGGIALANILCNEDSEENVFINADISGNELNNNLAGIVYFGMDNNYINTNLDISRNTITHNDTAGIVVFEVVSDDPKSYNTILANISNNVLENNGLAEIEEGALGGIYCQLHQGDNDTIEFNILNNQVTNNLAGITALYGYSSYENITTIISGNTVTNNDMDGIEVYQLSGSHNNIDTRILDNVVSGNGLADLDINPYFNSGISVLNTSNDNDIHNILISGNETSSNKLEAVVVAFNNTDSIMDIDLTNNNCTLNADKGSIGIISADNLGNFSLTAAVSGNTISNGVDSALYFETGGNAEETSALISVFNNTITGNMGGVCISEDEESPNAGVFTVDLGGGALESIGNNSIYNNSFEGEEDTYYDVDNDLVEIEGEQPQVSAEYNWWGEGTEEEGPFEYQINGNVDYSNWLVSPPTVP